MKIGITGLSASGKSTVFTAITHVHPKHEEGSGHKLKPHLGVVKVPDPRLDNLARFFNSKKVTHVELTLMDMPGFNIVDLGEADALIDVVGAFYSENPIRDIEEVEASLILRDLEVIQHKLPQMKKEIASGKTEEKRELEVLVKCEACLEKDTPLRSLALNNEEEKLVRGYQFLSLKPVLLVSNLAERDTDKGSPKELIAYAKNKNLKMIEFCGKTELDILEVPPEEREEFLKEMGIDVMAQDKLIKAAFDLLKLITFFTVKGEEARAWAIPEGTSALEAAGKIHTDMKKGFIRAEVVSYKDLAESGGKFSEARNKGHLKLEGKEYIVKDGEILDIRFNV